MADKPKSPSENFFDPEEESKMQNKVLTALIQIIGKKIFGLKEIQEAPVTIQNAYTNYLERASTTKTIEEFISFVASAYSVKVKEQDLQRAKNEGIKKIFNIRNKQDN